MPQGWARRRVSGRWRAAATGGSVHPYTSRDGTTWVRGGTWTHDLGDASIGLVSMGGAGFTAEFGYLRTYHATGCAVTEWGR